jgi:hypothetical protein
MPSPQGFSSYLPDDTLPFFWTHSLPALPPSSFPPASSPTQMAAVKGLASESWNQGDQVPGPLCGAHSLAMEQWASYLAC